MFHSLDEQIEITEGGHPTTGQGLLRFLGIAILSAVVFGELYLAIVALE